MASKASKPGPVVGRARKFSPEAVRFGVWEKRWVPLRRIDPDLRARALDALRRGETLPSGLVAGAQLGVSFSTGPIRGEDVDWDA